MSQPDELMNEMQSKYDQPALQQILLNHSMLRTPLETKSVLYADGRCGMGRGGWGRGQDDKD